MDVWISYFNYSPDHRCGISGRLILFIVMVVIRLVKWA
jgi:hypothetical protein